MLLKSNPSSPLFPFEIQNIKSFNVKYEKQKKINKKIIYTASTRVGILWIKFSLTSNKASLPPFMRIEIMGISFFDFLPASFPFFSSLNDSSSKIVSFCVFFKRIFLRISS